MRPFGALLPKEEALARLLAAAAPVTREEVVPLARAAGRVCAEDVRAPFDVPPFARATMDGYAVSGEGPRWRIVGDVFAGTAAPPLAEGQALRIATGAPLPAGARAVVRVEDTREEDGHVVARVALRERQNVDPAGVDLARGDPVVEQGALLDAPRIGLLASIGRAEVRLRARPRVALASTGDELLAPGAPPDPLRIYDSNSSTLAALFDAHGADVVRSAPVPDAREALERALDADADLVVLTGGASAGAKDLVVDALRARGEVLFHGVRVKPGKPLLVGRTKRALVVGLPGNPTSALSSSYLFVVPALRKMAGLPAVPPRVVDATLAAAVKGEPERFLFLPVKLDAGRALPTFRSSGALTSLAASDGWIGVPEGASLDAGARVLVTLW